MPGENSDFAARYIKQGGPAECYQIMEYEAQTGGSQASMERGRADQAARNILEHHHRGYSAQDVEDKRVSNVESSSK